MKSKGFILLTLLSLILTLCLTGCTESSSSDDSDKVLCQVCGEDAYTSRSPDYDYLEGDYCPGCLLDEHNRRSEEGTAYMSYPEDDAVCEICGSPADENRHSDYDYLGGSYCSSCLISEHNRRQNGNGGTASQTPSSISSSTTTSRQPENSSEDDDYNEGGYSATGSGTSSVIRCQVCGGEALLDRSSDFDYLGGNYCAECLMEAYFNSLE